MAEMSICAIPAPRWSRSIHESLSLWTISLALLAATAESLWRGKQSGRSAVAQPPWQCLSGRRRRQRPALRSRWHDLASGRLRRQTPRQRNGTRRQSTARPAPAGVLRVAATARSATTIGILAAPGPSLGVVADRQRRGHVLVLSDGRREGCGGQPLQAGRHCLGPRSDDMGRDRARSGTVRPGDALRRVGPDSVRGRTSRAPGPSQHSGLGGQAIEALSGRSAGRSTIFSGTRPLAGKAGSRRSNRGTRPTSTCSAVIRAPRWPRSRRRPIWASRRATPKPLPA